MNKLLFSTCLAALVTASGPASAEIVLRAATSLPTNLEFSQSFIKNFVEPLNERGEGVIRVEYVGGPETTPAAKMGSALSRGLFDIVHGPAPYYAGEVPEASALTAMTTSWGSISNGDGIDYLDGIWREKLNAHLLTWAELDVEYHLFLASEPKTDDNGNLDLSGLKLRTSPTYRPFFDELGVTAVNISVSELYAALERGIIDGLGYTEVGMAPLGVEEFIKYRIDPPFYVSPVLTIMNAEKYDGLPDDARRILDEVVAEYEKVAPDTMDEAARKDQQALIDAGMQVYELEGAAAESYLDKAYSALWADLETKVEDPERLRGILDADAEE